MDNRETRRVNSRPREFYQRIQKRRIYKVVPIKQCCGCLRRIGFGLTFISRVTAKDKNVVKKFVKHISPAIIRKSIPMTGPGRPKIKTWNSHSIMVEEYAREKNRLRTTENLWSRHPKIQSERSQRRTAWRLKYDFGFRALFYARKRVKNAIGKHRHKPCKSISKVIGCTGNFLALHLASQFRDGMTWNNHGKVWHIDHIRALATFDLSYAVQLSIASHWTNLQPLLAHENLSKGAKPIL